MNPSIVALLDLQVIDKRRLALKQAREQKQGKVADAEKTAAAAEAAAAAATAEVERMGALIRQYHADVERCDVDRSQSTTSADTWQEPEVFRPQLSQRPEAGITPT